MNLASLLAGFAIAPMLAQPQESQQSRVRQTPGGREVVSFQLTHSVGNPNRAVFVVGDLPELGSGSPVRSVKLVSEDDLNWEVKISLPAHRDFAYQFLEGYGQLLLLGNPSNYTAITPELTGRTTSTPAGPGYKTLQMHTAFREPVLHWRQGDGEYRTKRLREIGPGRTPSERRYGLRAFGLGGRSIQFFVTNSDGSERDPQEEGSTYVTSLDGCFLQDGEVFGYMPGPLVSLERFAANEAFEFPSAILGQERRYHVLLPRGYDEHVEKRYPVLYIYDAQFLWSPHPDWHSIYGTWDIGVQRWADLVRRGLVGETILVAIEFVESGNDCDIWLPRGRDCVPPGELVSTFECGVITGDGDRFLGFIVEELKPVIDATYRTHPDPEHTFASGFSFGGLFALYAGWDYGDTFGAIASQSGAMWTVPNFTNRVMAERRPQGLRIFLDTGSLEFGSAETILAIRDSLVSSNSGFVVEGDLRFNLSFGHDHTYTNAGRRMQSMMTFLWPATRDAGPIPWPVREP